MAASIRRRSGFTLIEILMVVIILGVIATIIIGLFSNTTADAASNALKDNLRSMRSALQIYVAQHGEYPTQTAFVDQMTQYTSATGATSPTADQTHCFGPYILAMPPLPVGINKGMNGLTGPSYTAGFGWQYNQTTGDFRANCPDTEVDGAGAVYHTF